jgi:hypothetical protein
MIRSEELALVQGWAATRRTLERWKEHPWPVVAGWAAVAIAVPVLLAAAAIETWVTPHVILSAAG